MSVPHEAVRDLLLLGRVSDIGSPGREASAIWIRDGRIVGVGGEGLRARAVEAGAETRDFGDAYLAPGFVDPHVHLEASAIADATSLDLRFPGVTTVADALERLARRAAGTREGEWVIAQANLFWDQKLSDRRFPTRRELDRACPRNPVAIRAGGHVSILNSLAFALADVEAREAATGMMGRAVIERDEAGELTGVIAELDALLPLPEVADDRLEGVLEDALYRSFTRRGVTTIGEITESRRGAAAFRALAERGRLSSRVARYLWVPGAYAAAELDDAVRADTTAFGETFVAGVKLFADGGYSSRNAAVLTPYLGAGSATESSRGDLNLSGAELRDGLEFVVRHGLQLLVHTNGERAQRQVLEALSAFEAVRGPLPHGTLRLEHFSNLLTEAETLRRLAASSADFVGQPTFVYTFSALLTELLGPVVEGGRQPYRTLVDGGILPAAASDIHMGAEPEQSSPLFGMWAAMERSSFRGTPVDPEQRVTGREALEMYTLSAARSMHLDREIGSLEIGKRADVVVLDRDVTRASSAEARSARVLEVLRDGISRIR